jgi:hypothetical protein
MEIRVRGRNVSQASVHSQGEDSLLTRQTPLPPTGSPGSQVTDQQSSHRTFSFQINHLIYIIVLENEKYHVNIRIDNLFSFITL